ncbi:MAG: leucyl aminopeptidase [Mycobacteriales bacterium]|nr:leucyl aminopeptidase [Mycobacteriales bacterium]
MAAPRSTSLPVLSLAATPGETAVLVLPTRAGDESVAVLGDSGLADAAGLLAREKAKGDAGEIVSSPVLGDAPLERLLLVGVGDGAPSALRKAGAAVARRSRGAASLTVDLRGLTGLTDAGLRALAEGALLAAYSFTRKAKAEPRVLSRITLVVARPEALQPAADRAVTTATATAAARDLVNEPSLSKTPDWLAVQAKRLLKGLTVTVRDEKALAAEGFGGVLAVGQGSSRPPRVIEASYDGGSGPHVVLVGKGITFDTGGLSLKPNDGMLAMKTDMGGGAAVLGALRAVADLGLPLRVTVLVAAAENMPSGTAQRPGDVITHFGGRTVEVLNTDAEGRLVLADAIAYADSVLDADVIVDVATLTGAMPVALGRRHAGLFASDDRLAAQLEAASAASGERLWRMPLTEDYLVALDSPIADLRNIGDPRTKLQGGSITAALFLREFTGGRPWAHLDIAGPGRSDGEEDELTKGGTGYGVRLLVHWLEALATPARTGRKRSA